MLKRVYSLYDQKACYYGLPFEAKTDADASRMFIAACRDTQSMIGQYPADFALYYIDNFDDNSGEFDGKEPKFIMNGSEVFANAVDPLPVQSPAKEIG